MLQYLQMLPVTNNSTQPVACEVVFTLNGVLQFNKGSRPDIQPGQRTGGIYGGLWSCGHSDTDSFKYACVLASDDLQCKVDMVKKAMGR